MSNPSLAEGYFSIGENQIFLAGVVGFFCWWSGGWVWVCFVLCLMGMCDYDIPNGSFGHVFLYFLSFFWALHYAR